MKYSNCTDQDAGTEGRDLCFLAVDGRVVKFGERKVQEQVLLNY